MSTSPTAFVDSYSVEHAIDLPAQVRAFERAAIMKALESASGKQRAAAQLLGLRPTTLHEKMKRLGIVVVRNVDSAFAA